MKMLKKLIFFYCIFIIETANAQSNLGLKTGLNAASLIGEGDNSEFRIGFNFGVSCYRPISDNLGIRPEFFYSSQGAKKLKYEYVYLPILLDVASDQFSFLIGPQIGVLWKATAKKDDKDEVITASLKNLDFGGVIGIRTSIGGNVFIDFRIAPSFTSTKQNFASSNFVISSNLTFRLK